MRAACHVTDGLLIHWRRWCHRHTVVVAALLLALTSQDIAGLLHTHATGLPGATAASIAPAERDRTQHTAGGSHSCSLCQVLAQGSAPPPRIVLLRHVVFTPADRATLERNAPLPASLRSHSWQGRAPPLI